MKTYAAILMATFFSSVAFVGGAKVEHDHLLARYDRVCKAQEKLSVCGYYEGAMNDEEVWVNDIKTGNMYSM